MEELKSIMEKFVASGWDLISPGLIPRSSAAQTNFF